MQLNAKAIGTGLARSGVESAQARKIIGNIAVARFHTAEARDKLYNEALIAYHRAGLEATTQGAH